MSKLIFADESYKSLDYLTSRTLFCYVEFDDEDNVKIAADVIQEKVINDTLRYSTKGKLHYTSFTPAQKASICDILSKLNYRCKVFVRYNHGVDSSKNEAQYKRELFTGSLKFMIDKQISSNDIVYIENAAGTYKKQGLANNIQLVDAANQPLFLVADVVLGVFCDYLDRSLTETQVITNYTLIKEKIRLQVIRSDEYYPQPLSRNQRI